MAWTGFAWLLTGFVMLDDPTLFTLAILVCNVYLAAFVHLLLAYPDGRAPPTRGSSRATYALVRDRPAADPALRRAGLRRLPGERDPGSPTARRRADRRRR